MDKSVGIVGLVLLVLFVAFTFPAVIGDTTGTTSETVTIQQGDSTVISDTLEISVAQTTDTDVELTATSLDSGESVTQTITETETASIGLDGQTVDITAVDTTSNDATLTVDYPRTFGLDSGSMWIAENIGILMVVLAFVAIMAALRGVINA